MDEDHDLRRKIIRQWMALPKNKRQTREQVEAFAKSATKQNEFHRSRRDPEQRFRRDPYLKVTDGFCLAPGSSDELATSDALPRGQHTLVRGQAQSVTHAAAGRQHGGHQKIQSAGSWIGWIAADVVARG